MLSTQLKYFKGSYIVTIIGAIIALLIGGPEVLFLVAVLAVLEISLSFDNAVVNATVLKDMDEVWRRRFLTWGILIAVFGMRIVFPIIIVSIVSGTTPWGALEIAIQSPDLYAKAMEEAHISVMAFGGSFLLMVGLDFFFDDEKQHWIPLIEMPVMHLGKVKYAAEVVTVFSLMAVGLLALPDQDEKTFVFSGIAGMAVFTVVRKISDFMEAQESARVAEHVAKSGFVMFMYLELLDASFSFDGVIGAFAITNNLFVIAIGLGIGAMFVRSLTILFVEKDTLDEYIYLEHGAFYAIVILAMIMYLKTFLHISEVITGCIGAGFIAVAFMHSIYVKKHDNDSTDAKTSE
jgi:hypothetical protein